MVNKIHIFGYYDEHNLGDESYKITFQMIFPKQELIFVNPNEITEIDKDIELIVCGGGDIINDWFFSRFNELFKNYKGKIYAISIGITYDSTINYLNMFEKIYLRHHLDYISNFPITFIPDLGFLLKKVNFEIPIKPKIGVFLANGINLVENFMETIEYFSQEYEIIFYPFNTSDKPHESDIKYMKELVKEKYQVKIITNVYEMLKEIAGLHFCICSRYHSHIFAITQNIPFISISNTRKVELLLKDWDLSNLKVKTNIKTKILELLESENYKKLKIKLSQVDQTAKLVLKSLKIDIDEKDLITECQEMIDKGIKEELIASHALYKITGSVHNKFSYGFIQNLKNKSYKLIDMINWIKHEFENTHKKIKFLQPIEEFEDIHRSGWYYASSLLKQFESSDAQLLCDLYVDGTFHWNSDLYKAQGIIPFKSNWIGFIHHTNSNYNEYNLDNLFKNELFLTSLKFCKGLITLSTNNKKLIDEKLKVLGLDIKTFQLYHPTEFTNVNFRYYNFLTNPKVIQIGSWLRDVYAIYYAPINFAKKHILIGKDMHNIMHPKYIKVYEVAPDELETSTESLEGIHYARNHSGNCVTCDCNSEKDEKIKEKLDHGSICRGGGEICIIQILNYIFELIDLAEIFLSLNKNKEIKEKDYKEKTTEEKKVNSQITKLNKLLKENKNSVTTIDKLENDDYDKLLGSSIVFLKLQDAAAVNTIIECIIRNTPIIVNKLPAVVEYLGEEYPLYYENINDLKNMDVKLVHRAYMYLLKMNKSKFNGDHFIKSFKEILEQVFKN